MELAPNIAGFKNKLLVGDCGKIMEKMFSESVDLIVTSPPYADARKKQYEGIPPERYVGWFVPIAHEMHRVLKPAGSLVLNIKEKVTNGERDTYVLELILAMRKIGWLWTEEYIWHKSNCFPGKWPNRFRDAWERCLHFTKQRKFYMDQDAVRIPMGDWKNSRLKNLSATDKRRDNSHVKSGFGKNISNWVGRDLAYPSNVLRLATECGNKGHSAAFPIALPTFFIKLFSKPGDAVLDPFVGSGTTAIAARELGRDYIGIDKSAEFIRTAEDRLNGKKPAVKK